MKRKKGIDRLSALPDSLIHHIFSFLEMREVVNTAVLSKRWEHFWLTVPCLHFQDIDDDVDKFCNFVNRALMLWRGTYLHQFTIGFSENSSSGSELPSDMDLWVRFATDRKVEELCIRLTAGMILEIDDLYHPPPCLYKCSSIRKLSLSGCILQCGGNVQWNCLVTLELSRCIFSEDVIDKIVSSPRLETFSLHCPWVCSYLSIRSSSLKNLSIYFTEHFPRNFMVLTIWAPNVEALELSNIPFHKCLLKDVSSLREVNLDDFFSSCDAGDGKAICRFLEVIQHVGTIKVSVGSAKIVEVMKDKYSFSPLLNVKLLKIGRGLYEFRELVSLVEIFPRVEMLIIDWNFIGVLFESDAEANILKSNLSQLRRVKITWYTYMSIIFEFVEIVLKHAAMIEKIVIEKETSVDVEDMFLAANKVVTLQRSFPTVELLLCRKLPSEEEEEEEEEEGEEGEEEG